MKIAVIEDDNKDADALIACLERLQAETSVPLDIIRYKSANTFLKEYGAQFDLLLMDIEMSGIDGMTAAKEIRKADKKVYIVFVTNMAKYAIKGYEVGALDYFLKPVSYSDVKLRLTRIISEKKKEGVSIIVFGQNNTRKFSTEDLLYMESQEHSIIFHLKDESVSQIRPRMIIELPDKKIELIDANLKTITPVFETIAFSRCNSCYLVNLKHCRRIDGFDLTIGNETIQISHTKKKRFMEEYLNFIRS